MKEQEKERIIGFRVSEAFYNKYLKHADNKSRYIRNQFIINENNPITIAFQQYNNLFKAIADHFEEGRKTIALDEFMDLVRTYIDYDKIDKARQRL
jgi:hypothetical protein